MGHKQENPNLIGNTDIKASSTGNIKLPWLIEGLKIGTAVMCVRARARVHACVGVCV